MSSDSTSPAEPSPPSDLSPPTTDLSPTRPPLESTESSFVSNPISATEKGKGRAAEPEMELEPAPVLLSEPREREPEREREPVANPPVDSRLPVDTAGDGPATDALPGHLERFSLDAPPAPLAADAPIARTPTPPAPLDDEWILKSIHWPPLPPPPSGSTPLAGPTISIITQNRNGPCSLIALCNILILRGDIVVQPPDRASVSYGYLSSLFADYLLRLSFETASTSPEQANASLSTALSLLPTTLTGLSLNPRFGSIDGFSPQGELALFSLSRVPLYHGWVVDPQDEESWEVVVGEAGDYDTAVEMQVAAAEISGGVDGEGSEREMLAAVERTSRWTAAEERKVHLGSTIAHFLSTSQTQLTYHGLFLLSSHLAPGSLSALFRNSHLSVIYRRPFPAPGQPELFTLVTDSSFTGDEGIVWESLEDVEGSASEFFDAALRRRGGRGGDWVGRRPRREDGPAPIAQPIDDSGDPDLALARQLQHEEDEYARRREHHEQRPPPSPRRDERDERDERPRSPPVQPKKAKKGQKDKCTVM